VGLSTGTLSGDLYVFTMEQDPCYFRRDSHWEQICKLSSQSWPDTESREFILDNPFATIILFPNHVSSIPSPPISLRVLTNEFCISSAISSGMEMLRTEI
jgi:hypothetical protein